jgi:predicted MPP superfamily phosphohydrolase
VKLNRLSRRQLLKLSAGSLLGAGFWPGALRAEGDGGAAEFRFVAVNDTHFINEKCAAFQQKVVQQINAGKEKIDFCVILGDLANEGKREELGGFKEVYKKLNVPRYQVIGNHDYVAQDDRKAFEELFPDSLNYSFEHKGWQFVGLDTSHGLKYSGTTIQTPTLNWVDEAAKKLDTKRPTVVLTHFPLGTVKYRPKNADDLLARFKEHNLQAAMSGHFHGFTEVQMNQVTLTTNKCCALQRGNHDGTKEKGYFICHAKDGKLTRTFVEVPQ